MQSEIEILAELQSGIAETKSIHARLAEQGPQITEQLATLNAGADDLLARQASNGERLITLENSLQALNAGINDLPKIIHGREIEAGKIVQNLGI